MMKVITLWQPWASLIMIGAKPFEFRRWNYLARGVGVAVDDRIGIHAGARPIKLVEIEDLLERLDDPICSTGLDAAKARPLLQRIAKAHKGRGVVEMSALLGTARIGEPLLSTDAMPKWSGSMEPEIGDSDRLEHCKWAWPMSGIERLENPIPMKGWQGFWNYHGTAKAA